MKKRTLLITVLLTAALLGSVLLTSCGKQKTKFTAYSLDFFDTATTIVGYERDKDEFDRISAEMLAALEEYHKLFTIYQCYDGMENLCTVNQLTDGVHPVVKVDERIIDMLLFAKEMYALTNGKFNIAMGSVLSIWHEYRTKGLDDEQAAQLPPMELLTEASQHTDINDVIIDTENSTVWLADPQMTLDVGAIGKGYAVEMVARLFEERQITGYVINAGGNVRALGSKPDDAKWVTGLENPGLSQEDDYLAYLHISDEAVVTSGSYQRYYTVGGKSYHHIIDSQTLMPSDKYISVSVVCKDSAMADALSTALFCMELDEGMALVESLSDTEAHWVMPDKSKYTSSGFSAYTKEG